MPNTAAIAPEAASVPPALSVEGLVVCIGGEGGSFPVVQDMAFTLLPGETLAIVGESGCGKTMTALALMGLQPKAARIERGAVRIGGIDLLTMSRTALEDMRGRKISMIFQEPLTSLNPVMTIGGQIAETVRRHRKASRSQALARATEMLELVRIPDAQRRAGEYPHQFSGGMRQRAMIALALANEPAVLIADEPTTALDVTIQAEVLALIRDLQKRLGTALLLITHDFGVVAGMADRAIVMYAGRRVEAAPVEQLFDNPRHPYTRALMRATPHLAGDGVNELQEIGGMVPPPWDMPEGCAFAPRCHLAMDRCIAAAPPLKEKPAGHFAACWAEADE